MYLDYSKIKSGQIKQPVLRLRTLAGKELGSIPWAYNVAFEINYTDLSKIEFDVPFQTDGMLNPVYAQLTGYKVLYTETYGIYLLTRPTISGDGMSEVKHVTGYSLEWLFEKKKLFLEEGTYNFWNPVQPADTILGRIVELDTTWTIGYVDPKLIGCYRTFDEYNSDPLNFCYGDAMEKYHCAIVFDVYEKTINAYDAGESRGKLPIYLSYQNLVDAVHVEELTDDMATKLRLYGSDSLTIRDVNPIGTDYLVDLSWFISNGDLDIKVGGSAMTLAEKVQNWNIEIKNQQEYYTSLVAARASKSAQKLAEEVHLTTLNGELDTLTVQQSVIVQALALETTSAGKVAQQKKLDEINTQIEAKKDEISHQEVIITSLEAELEGYVADIKAVNNTLALGKYFTKEEQKILNLYLIEGEITEETFVATEIDTSASGAASTVYGEVDVEDSALTRITLNGKNMYVIDGGTLKVLNANIIADIVQGTLEAESETGDYVLTAYLGATAYGERNFPSGMITMSGTLSQFSSDISAVTENDVTEYKGSYLSFEADSSRLFFTVNVNEYQKYSVAKELYSFGEEILGEKAWPVYEFSIDSANFLFQREFEPFKNKLELGKSIRLDMGNGDIIEPNLIGIAFGFEDPENFTLTFSNHFQKKNVVKTLLNSYNKSSSSSRSFDASKYIYNRTVEKADQASKFMDGTLNAAVNTIVGAANKTVEINGAGIQVGGDSNYQLRIVDNMIAMTDDGWKTAKLGVGLFATEETGQQWGFNGELVAGKLLVGNNLVLENQLYDENNHPTGVMQFKVDSTGAWLNNSTFVLQKDSGGRMILDPDYGLLAGSSTLFDTEGTTVKPSFIDSNGKIVLDEDGMPKDTNFFLDIRDGNAYFRGKVFATDGVFNGDVYAKNGEFSGMVYAKGGEFDGIVKARDLQFPNGDSMTSILNDKGKIDANWLDLMGINVMNKAGETVMTIDENGLRFSKKYSPIAYQFSTSLSGPWHDTMAENDKYRRDSLDGGITWGEPYQFKGTDGSDGSDANVNWNNVKQALSSAAALNESIITIDSVGAPNIYGGKIYGTEIYAGESSNVFARVDGAGLCVFNDATEIPKVQVGVDTEYGQWPQIILGSGTGASSGMNGRMYITKMSDSAQIIYADSSGNTCGFSFGAGGIIEPIGELNVAARFG